MRQNAALVSEQNHYHLNTGERWYVAQTLATRESHAENQLRRQGFQTFLPQQLKNVKHARKLMQVRRAVFPGYVFVAVDVQRHRWRSINGTFGVSCLIMAGERPLPVPQGIVERLVDYLDERGLCRLDRDLVEGQSVRVTSGPFSDFIGRLASLDDKGRVRVLLEMLGGEVMTTLDRASLEAV